MYKKYKDRVDSLVSYLAADTDTSVEFKEALLDIALYLEDMAMEVEIEQRDDPWLDEDEDDDDLPL